MTLLTSHMANSVPKETTSESSTNEPSSASTAIITPSVHCASTGVCVRCDTAASGGGSSQSRAATITRRATE